MTNHWIDIKNSDCILIMGSNAAENHPVSFKYVTEAMENGATLISVDPRFTRTSSKADIYAPLRSGTDIAFLGGMIKYILDNERYHKEYVALHTNAPFIVGNRLRFHRRPVFRLRKGFARPLRAGMTRASGPLKWMPTACPRWTARSSTSAAFSNC